MPVSRPRSWPRSATPLGPPAHPAAVRDQLAPQTHPGAPQPGKGVCGSACRPRAGRAAIKPTGGSGVDVLPTV
jgi:hypothetical protein